MFKKVLLVTMAIAAGTIAMIPMLMRVRTFSDGVTKSDGSRVRVGSFSMIVPGGWGYQVFVESDGSEHLNAYASTLRYATVFHIAPSSEADVKPLELSVNRGSPNSLENPLLTSGRLFVRTDSGRVFLAQFSLNGKHEVIPHDLLAAFHSIQDEVQDSDHASR